MSAIIIRKLFCVAAKEIVINFLEFIWNWTEDIKDIKVK